MGLKYWLSYSTLVELMQSRVEVRLDAWQDPCVAHGSVQGKSVGCKRPGGSSTGITS